MADQFGAITIPVATPAAGDPAGDPCLRIVLDYLKAFLVTDANVTAAWAPIFADAPPIKSTFPHDPNQVVFSNAHLPALYMWRESGKSEKIGDGLWQNTTQVKALWVFPDAGQNAQRVRQPFVNALEKGILDAIERGRTPSWVCPGDPDPRAAGAPNVPAEGSYVWTWARVSTFELDRRQSWRKARLDIDMADRSKPSLSYPAVELSFTLEEVLDVDITRSPPTYPVAGDLTLKNEVGDVTVEGPL